MRLQIFDVEHGACALLTCDDGKRLMIDCGHNSDTGWRPGTYLREQGITSIEMLAVTNYDEDHVSGIVDLCGNVSIGWLFRNPSVSARTIRNLKSEDGMGRGIEHLVYLIENVFTGGGGGTILEPAFSGLVHSQYWNVYPRFDDENNLSMVIHLKCEGIGVMFPGDLEREGWLALVERPAFQRALRDTQVLVASHHGRENGCCEEVFKYCNPYYVVISDKGYVHDTQECVPFYKRFARGGPFRGDTRYVLTTRNEGRIEFNFSQRTWNAG
jgi:beta-lactamase superfamily II metal-dependent hydrolase